MSASNTGEGIAHTSRFWRDGLGSWRMRLSHMLRFFGWLLGGLALRPGRWRLVCGRRWVLRLRGWRALRLWGWRALRLCGWRALQLLWWRALARRWRRRLFRRRRLLQKHGHCSSRKASGMHRRRVVDRSLISCETNTCATLLELDAANLQDRQTTDAHDYRR